MTPSGRPCRRRLGSKRPAVGRNGRGEVRKVDMDQANATIRHEALTNLGTLARTVALSVKDTAKMDAVKEAQYSVRCRAQ